MEKLVSLAKRRGYFFQSSEIYGGIQGVYDFGPLGVALRNNIKRAWWRTMVELRDDVVGIDAGIIMNPRVWEASGHVQNFTDPLVECKKCHQRFRADEMTWLDYWKNQRLSWYQSLGIRPERLRLRAHGKDELAHYARGAFDVEYEFPFGWSELEGIAARGDYDLAAHQRASGKDLSYFDDIKRERYLPHVVEPSAGVDRTMLTLLIDAYHEEEVRGEQRVVLKLDRSVAPILVAVLPLSRKEPLTQLAQQVEHQLRPYFRTEYDDTQSIGKRYRRQDEIGTPFAVTVDFEAVNG